MAATILETRKAPGSAARRITVSTLNVGNLDRLVRLLGGIFLLACAATGAIGSWGYIGLALMLSGVVAYCPLYGLAGLSTTSR
jgi:hypothetical protein